MSTRPLASDLAAFMRYMSKLGTLTKDDLNAVAPLLSVRKLGAGEHFLRAGEQAEYAALVTNGSVREYYGLADGTERVKAFVFAPGLTGSMADLLSKSPSTSNIVADEEARLLVMRFDDLSELARRMRNWDNVFRILTQQLYLRKARREYELLALDAQARYATLLEQQPDIETRVQARHIASYLGVTPVHLSRLRRRRKAAEKRRP
ncbi:MAG: Crp/Fnr family transcriptional regulator [Myxococcales bacterium]